MFAYCTGYLVTVLSLSISHELCLFVQFVHVCIVSLWQIKIALCFSFRCFCKWREGSIFDIWSFPILKCKWNGVNLISLLTNKKNLHLFSTEAQRNLKWFEIALKIWMLNVIKGKVRQTATKSGWGSVSRNQFNLASAIYTDFFWREYYLCIIVCGVFLTAILHVQYTCTCRY